MARPITDGMLGAPQVAALAQRLEDVLGAGADLRAVRAVAGRLDGVTLTGRVALLRDALLAELPADWPAFARVVRRALDDERFAGWIIWPVGDAVAARALEDTHPRAFDEGLDLLAALTPRLTSEFSLRPFLAANLEHTLRAARRWAEDADQHVRRLASEGTRPRLPWAPRARALLDRPEATIPILDALYQDPCDRVRRSVANHLGDLAKDHPELAVATASHWLQAPDRSTASVVRHGLRALVKTGHPGALTLQGFDPPDQIAVSGPHLATRVVGIGERLEFATEVSNRGTTTGAADGRLPGPLPHDPRRDGPQGLQARDARTPARRDGEAPVAPARSRRGPPGAYIRGGTRSSFRSTAGDSARPPST